ncbi:MAG: tRNA(His) guanylyltransferase Thg1 family protein [Acidobacteriota bacterium]
MNSDVFAAKMRSRELFQGTRVPERCWLVLRVDGRGFSRLTERLFEKPFDPRFHEWMIEAARALLEDNHGRLALVVSDEISLLLPPGHDQHGGRLEKLVSLTAGLTSATFSSRLGEPATFDSRAWSADDVESVVDYFRWRQSDARRCALQGWCYWTLRHEGASSREATERLRGLSHDGQRELLSGAGIDFDTTPPWQRRGSLVFWEEHDHRGVDPTTGSIVESSRRRTAVDRDLAERDAFGDAIESLLQLS